MLSVKVLKIREVFLSVLSFSMVEISLFEVSHALKLLIMRGFVKFSNKRIHLGVQA